jgi:hypothetical protein
MESVQTIEHGDIIAEIIPDENPPNPREEFDNMGKMVCFHKRYSLGDKHDYQEENFTSWDELAAQIDKDVGGAFVLPIRMYDHSGIGLTANPLDFLRYPWNCPWDSGWVGFIFVSKNDVRKEYSTKRITKKIRERAISVLQAEVEEYNRYLNGEVYGYVVKNKAGDVFDSCWGFYGLKYAVDEAESMLKDYETKN